MVEYNNAVITLTRTARPDPFAVKAPNGKYYLTFTAGNRIDILAADSLVNFRDKAEVTTIWRPPPKTHYSGDLWAPELHALGGRWYVYFAADDPKRGNRSHRMYILGGPSAESDPTADGWEFLGPVRGLPDDQWAIDGTVFHLNGDLHFCYSGWPASEKHSDLIQELWIAQMKSPTEARGQAVMICKPDLDFEFTYDDNGAHGINEGPQWLESPNGVWSGIIYSCSGAWSNQYKMNTLQYQGGDPLNAGSWRKGTKPLLQNTPDQFGPWAPGHGNFLNLGGQTVAVFHATDLPTDGWSNRKARCQRVAWTMHGPTMGGYVGVLTEDVDVFTKHSKPSDVPHGHRHGFHALFTGEEQKVLR